MVGPVKSGAIRARRLTPNAAQVRQVPPLRTRLGILLGPGSSFPGAQPAHASLTPSKGRRYEQLCFRDGVLRQRRPSSFQSKKSLTETPIASYNPTQLSLQLAISAWGRFAREPGTVPAFRAHTVSLQEVEGKMKQISRRTFVVAGTGVVGFTFLPAHVLGFGDATPPSEKLNLAFVGIGARGALNVTELNNLQQNIVAVCDVDWRHREAPRRAGADPNRLGAARRMSPILLATRDYPNAKRYDDYRKMLDEEDKNIDGVVISTPDHLSRPHRAGGNEAAQTRVRREEHVPHD